MKSLLNIYMLLYENKFKLKLDLNNVTPFAEFLNSGLSYWSYKLFRISIIHKKLANLFLSQYKHI